MAPARLLPHVVALICADGCANQPRTPQQQAQDADIGLQLLQMARPGGGATTAPMTAPVAFFKRSYDSGFNRICFYDRLGSEVAITISATALCPQTIR